MNLTSLHFSLLLATFAVVFIAILMLLGHISDAVGRVKPALAGLALSCAGVVNLPLTGTWPFMIGSMALFGAGYGLFFPALSAMVADGSSPDEYGRASGLYHALLTVGVSVGAPVMGWVAGSVGTAPALSLAAVPLLGAVGLALHRLSYESPERT